MLAVGLVLSAIPVAAQSADGFDYEELGHIRHELLGDDVVRSGRIVLRPGATLPMSEFSVEWEVRVKSGLLAVEGSFGRLQVDDSIADAYVASDDDTLWVRPGSQLRFDDGITMRWSNPGDEPTVLLTMSIIDEEDEPILALEEAEARRREARIEPFEHPVVKRVVLRKPASRVCDHEITIRVRSGRLIGARIPNRRSCASSIAMKDRPASRSTRSPVGARVTACLSRGSAATAAPPPVSTSARTSRPSVSRPHVTAMARAASTRSCSSSKAGRTSTTSNFLGGWDR